MRNRIRACVRSDGYTHATECGQIIHVDARERVGKIHSFILVEERRFRYDGIDYGRVESECGSTAVADSAKDG